MQGLPELSNLQIDNYFKNNNKYLGCFSKDLLPNKTNQNDKFMIINNDDSTGEGSHWVALYLLKNVSFFFDPFGLCPNEDTHEFMRKRKKPMYYSDCDLQNLDSSSCGWWCIYVMNQMSKGRKFLDILYDDFTSNTKTNEKYLINFFRKNI